MDISSETSNTTDRPQIEIDLPGIQDVTRGGGVWPLTVDYVENWAWRQGIFTPEELDAIIAIGNSTELYKASTMGGQSDEFRNSFVSFLFPCTLTNWIFERLAAEINEMNAQFFKFDLSSMDQGLQFTRYTAPGGHYEWHTDRGYNMSVTRKLSLSVQLSDPNDYVGGEFEMMLGKDPQQVTKERGFTVFFPSYTVHRVRPVTQGTRYSLVAWISGPAFR